MKVQIVLSSLIDYKMTMNNNIKRLVLINLNIID